MSDVKRYDCYGKDALGYDYPALSREAIDGDWVLAEDHIAECDALRARLADIQGILDEAQKIVTACLDDKARLAEAERERLTAARALVKAFNELNAIRARDGVPRDYAGMKVGIDEEYFSSVVDDVDAAVLALTGRGAHCHPLLYERTTDSAPAGAAWVDANVSGNPTLMQAMRNFAGEQSDSADEVQK